jgi:hypothetical protein
MQPFGRDAFKYNAGPFRVEDGRTIWLCEEVISLRGGVVPPGYRVTFLDGDAYNCTYGNLRVVRDHMAPNLWAHGLPDCSPPTGAS